MKLQRRFDWANRERIYKRVVEDEVEKATGGMIRFTAVDAQTGEKYVGAGFETTVSSMCDAEYWKLDPNPKKPEKSIVVPCNIPLPESPNTCAKVSGGPGTKAKRKGD